MTEPAYGYAHKARVVRLGEAEETYLVEIPDLAPGILSGPFMSAVRDLQPEDVVLVLQMGITGGDLVIVGRLPAVAWDSHLPIGIGDVTGLTAALDDRATDAELAALASSTDGRLDTLEATDATQEGRLTSIEALNTTQDGRLSAVEALNTTQDGRLTGVEGVNTTQDGRLTVNEAGIAANGTAIGLLNIWGWANQWHDVDTYGDLINFGLPRGLFGTTHTLGGGIARAARTRVRRDVTINQMRVYVTVAGVGASGVTTAGIYKSATALGTYTLVSSGTAALTATGRQNITVGAAALSKGDYVLAFFTTNLYSSSPAHAGLVNAPYAALVNPAGANVWASKGGVLTAPATIDMQDGTWTAQQVPWWVALA